MTGAPRRPRQACVLRGVAWDHPRCLRPLRACAAAWTRHHPGVRVEWDVRSLERFGDEPLHQVAEQYDLLTIDHPLCGLALATESLVPLDELLSREQLDAVAADSLGPSFSSYAYAGRQWALPVDGACQVSAVRDELLEGGPVPVTWEDALELAHRRPGSVALPLAPAHVVSSFLTHCAAHGAQAAASRDCLVDPERGIAALEWLATLARHGPAEATRWEPPDLLARLTSDDSIAYVPLTYGYVTYCLREHVARPCRFVDIPRIGAEPSGAVLGGVGLAVSRSARHPAEAAAFSAWVASAGTQRSIVAPSGGQPSSRSAWLDPDADRAANFFYSGTMRSMEHAWVRPREPWWPAFQVQAGGALVDLLERRRPAAEAYRVLESVYRRVRSLAPEEIASR